MNSLTANNRLSQQLVVSVAEHLLLRHECRLPNHLAVSNHRELYLTVGGELCRNLTAGFVTEEDFMFMLFVGSQKHSALSIFAKTTRMSALVLCGNSGVILLSVKDHQHIDSAIPGRYTVQAPYKAGAGIGVLELIKAIYDAPASFLSSAFAHIKVMVGWAGASKDAPVSLITGYANPVQFTTSEIGVSGGGSISPIKEAAIMATVPALTRLNDEDLHKLSYVTTALRALRKVTLSDPQAHQLLVSVRELRGGLMSNKYCQALVELRNKPAHELKEVGDQWRTPDNIFWGINTLFGPFVLDLFTDGDNAKCAAYYTAEDNALAHDWSERLAELKGAAFGNPPYSRASQHEGQYITGMRYIMKHASAMRDKGGRYVFLIKAATSEVWWPEDADHIAFIRGRIGFELPAWFIPKDEKQVPTGAFFAGAIAVFDKTWKGPAISYIGRDELEACGEAFLAQVRQQAEKLVREMVA